MISGMVDVDFCFRGFREDDGGLELRIEVLTLEDTDSNFNRTESGICMVSCC